MFKMLPYFNNNGFLPKGIHQCSGCEFVERYCSHDGVRHDFFKGVTDLFDFAKARFASYVFVGGSFVSEAATPSDLDAVVVFRNKEAIPSRSERLLISGKRIDIMFCSEDDPTIVDSFLELFSKNRHGLEDVGVVQVNISNDSQEWIIRHPLNEDQLEVIRKVYFYNDLVNLNTPEGILVTVHGIRTTAGWNSEVMPAFSSRGWIVAPFDYGFQQGDAIVKPKVRKQIVDDFREWIFNISQTYDAPITVIAHSFGTYIVGAYLEGFEEKCPVSFETVILTGCILSESYDWNKHCGVNVGAVRNEVAPNDQWVKYMPKPTKWLGLDPLFGQAGVKGFSQDCDILDQPRNTIFDHNNVIKKDVINQSWIPYIQAKKYQLLRQSFVKLRT